MGVSGDQGPLESGEIKAVFTAVESGKEDWRSIRDAMERVSGHVRHRQTCNSAMIIAQEFLRIGPKGVEQLNDPAAVMIVDLCRSYPATIEKVLKFQRSYLTWFKEKEDEKDRAQGPIVVSEALYRLIGQWRSEIRYPHLKVMLEIWLRSLPAHQVLRQSMPDKRKEFYRSVAHHLESIPNMRKYISGPILKVHQDSLFNALQVRCPDDVVWQMDDTWRKAYVSYYLAFTDWRHDVETIRKTHLDEGVLQAVFDEISSSGFYERQHPAFGQYVDFLQVAVALDLLVLAMGEFPSSEHWAVELAGLHRLRGDIVQHIMTLDGGIFQHTDFDTESVAKAIWATKIEEGVQFRQETIDVLHSLDNLRLIHDELTNELEVFQKRLKIS